MSEFLRFEVVRDTGKTKVVAVNSKSSGNRLAIISWHGAWRQYVIKPEYDTIWNDGCLEGVIAYMRGLMAERQGGNRARDPD